jgi:hypothetical protein
MSKHGTVTDSDKYDGDKSNSKNIIKYNILILLNLLGLLGLSEEFPAFPYGFLTRNSESELFARTELGLS